MTELVRTSNIDFFQRTIDGIEGWLAEYAALVTMALFDVQDQRQVRGPLVEIGIFKGKYFSILMREAKRSGDTAFGIDNFGFVPEASVRSILAEKMPEHDYVLIAKSSNSFTSDELMLEIGGSKARFMSIDGSHERDDVIWDLVLAEETCSSEGVISVDDFMNITAVGVNEGVHQFFRRDRNLVPFAFLMNKLFLCRPHMYPVYKNLIENYVENNAENIHSAVFLENRSRYRESIEQALFGKKVLTIW